MLRRSAHLPDALVRLSPDLSQMPKNDLSDCGAAVDRRETMQMALVECVEDLTKNIELSLARGIVTDADRPRTFVTRQPRQLPLGQPSLAAEPVHDLDLVRATSDGAEQPVAPRPRFVGISGIQQRQEGKGGVAQPAIPVVPVAGTTDQLRQRGRWRGNDGASRRIG